MAQGAAAPNAAAEPAGPLKLFGQVIHFIAIFSMINFAVSQFSGGDSSSKSKSVETKPAPGQLDPLWPLNVGTRLYVELVGIDPSHEGSEPLQLGNATFDDLTFSPNDPERSFSVMIRLDECFARNCTVVARGVYEADADFIPSVGRVVSFNATLSSFKQKKVAKEVKLFEDGTEPVTSDGIALQELAPTPEGATAMDTPPPATPAPLTSYVAPSFTVCPMPDYSVSTVAGLPDWMTSRFIPADPTDVALSRRYLPIVYPNQFWTLSDHLIELNKTTVQAPVNFTFATYPISFMKLSMYLQFENGPLMKMHSAKDMDEMKRVYLETNPVLLAVTIVVSILHLVFEYLAFSNDIKFWRGRKEFVGLSVRTVGLNCYFQTVIFLYLLDGGETSWTVLLPSGIGVVLEFWKLRKTLIIERDANGRFLRVSFIHSYDQKTRSYDETATRYLFYACIPLLIGYSIYTALNDTHKGWYSYLIKTQVRFIYLAGFVSLCPQIFINYKMKSVAHLPWRTFVYKALNTFIDDLFAFIIKMPTMHRLACFRDDIVFLILLYQRYIYPVDHTRTESGASLEADGAPAAAADGAATPAAAIEGDTAGRKTKTE